MLADRDELSRETEKHQRKSREESTNTERIKELTPLVFWGRYYKEKQNVETLQGRSGDLQAKVCFLTESQALFFGITLKL